MKSPVSLLPEISSSYRLFLRAISASVLHHPTATRRLRTLWRPSFAKAARVNFERRQTHGMKRLKVPEEWMKKWNERVDNTLQMLLSSATSRGLSHRVTRNLGFLTDAYIKSQSPKPSSHAWDPQLSAKSQQYSPPPLGPLSRKDETRLRRESIDAGVFRALGQIIRLAEGRSGVTLGRLTPVRK